MMDQSMAPLAQALQAHSNKDILPFDVPGHKGKTQEFAQYYGEKCLRLDKNSRKELDYLCQPTGVIRDAEQLAAEAFGAKDAFFMVGGTTSSVQAMVMCACTSGDKIILPRSVHISIINAVILSGATPVFIDPMIHPKLGIALGLSTADVMECICHNTDAKAIVVNNPTYYGVCSDLQKIVEIAHSFGILVLVDEAHGTHFYFHEDMPANAMECGADLSAVSMHKTGGSLTQSSILLSSGTMERGYVERIINLTCTTSPSYLLMSSLDLARRELVQNGREKLSVLIERVANTRRRINSIGGYYAFGEELCSCESVYAFDPTKLSVNTSALGLAGIEVYSLLRDQYGIQIEFGDISNILAICTINDGQSELDTLYSALKDIFENNRCDQIIPFFFEYIKPLLRMTPRKAFFAPKEYLPISEAVHHICGEAVMCYPPGIPLLAPGELVTQEIADHILFASQKGCQVTGLKGNAIVVVR